jgi:glyoxylase-like metal-dependent hydrolase (beta-lactamase superfamily II)
MTRDTAALPSVFLLAAALALATAGCGGLQRAMMKKAIPEDYFETEVARGPLFEQVAERTYAYRYGFERSLVVDTGEGLAVFDCFDTAFTTALRAELTARFPGVPVRWLFYSHHHLDHVRGGAVLAPVEVVSHENALRYWKDWDTSDVVMPTRTLRGDQALQLGQVEVRLLDLGLSHTDSLFAFHLPAQRVVYAPDMGFVHTLPPFGLPDFYYPGYVRALDRIAALDFDAFVASHFDRGTREDFLAYRAFFVETRERVATALKQRGGQPTSGRMVRDILDEVYPALQARYGGWHGFDAMMFPLFVRQVGGEYLGY